MITKKKQKFSYIHTDTFHPDEQEIEYKGVAIMTQGKDVDGEEVDEVEIMELYRDGVPVNCSGSGRDWNRFLGIMRQAARDRQWRDHLAAESAQSVRVTVYDVVNVPQSNKELYQELEGKQFEPYDGKNEPPFETNTINQN